MNFKLFGNKNTCEPSEDLIDYEQNEVYDNDIFPIDYKNDSQRLKDEYRKLSSKNGKLYDIVNDLNTFSNKNFGKSILLTMVYRLESEQDYLYRNSEKYKQRKFKSPHQFWHAVDLRSRTFSKEEIKIMVDYVNVKYNDDNYYRFTADYHTVGAGWHFHLQFAKK